METKGILAPAALVAAAALIATAAMAQTAAPPAGGASAGGGLADKLINLPASASWYVFGSGQTSQPMPGAAPKGYSALRVSVAAKGANPWDVGAVSPIAKPI